MEIRRGGRQDNSVSIDTLATSHSTTEGDVNKRLLGQEILEAGAETGLVIVPLQTILLGFTHLRRMRTDLALGGH